MRKLGVDNKHRRSLLANGVIALYTNGYIVTTETRAKEIKRMAEKMITKGKKGTLMARRDALAFMYNDKEIVTKLFSEIAPAYAERNGGYTRILKLDERRGDGVLLVRLELVK